MKKEIQNVQMEIEQLKCVCLTYWTVFLNSVKNKTVFCLILSWKGNASLFLKSNELSEWRSINLYCLSKRSKLSSKN